MPDTVRYMTLVFVSRCEILATYQPKPCIIIALKRVENSGRIGFSLGLFPVRYPEVFHEKFALRTFPIRVLEPSTKFTFSHFMYLGTWKRRLPQKNVRKPKLFSSKFPVEWCPTWEPPKCGESLKIIGIAFFSTRE